MEQILQKQKDEEGFVVREPFENTRVIAVYQDGVLGNHWREYSEVYGVISSVESGSVDFTLEDIDTRESKIYKMKTGDMLTIPPRIALAVDAKEGDIILSASSENYNKSKTHEYVLVSKDVIKKIKETK